ncbi:hypothetical protein CVD28_08570 [Bacillus sp. M6-12]|nr:hypothetical protein CVD28_08570 [Bacillus sp. M6-12]
MSAGITGQGRPRKRKAPRRLPNHPRKANAWSGNQQPSLTEPFISIKNKIGNWYYFYKLLSFGYK